MHSISTRSSQQRGKKTRYISKKKSPIHSNNKSSRVKKKKSSNSTASNEEVRYNDSFSKKRQGDEVEEDEEEDLLEEEYELEQIEGSSAVFPSKSELELEFDSDFKRYNDVHNNFNGRNYYNTNFNEFDEQELEQLDSNLITEPTYESYSGRKHPTQQFNSLKLRPLSPMFRIYKERDISVEYKAPSRLDDREIKLDSNESNDIEILKRELKFERTEREKLEMNLKRCLKDKRDQIALMRNAQKECERLKSELKNAKLSNFDELERAKSEINAISREYYQVMSERDSVLKEIEALQEQLSKSNDRIKDLSKNVNTSSRSNHHNHHHHQHSSLIEGTYSTYDKDNSFDRSIERNIERNIQANAPFHELQLNILQNQLGLITKQRDEAIVQIGELYKRLSVDFDSVTEDQIPEELSNSILDENKKLKLQVTSLIKDLEICKKRRDWAFNERDKILRERESIRVLSDQLRYQRDKAISELADSLRECDDLVKKNSMCNKRCRVLEEKLTVLEENLAYIRAKEEENEIKKSLNDSFSSSVSSIFQDPDSRILKVEIELEENHELGVEFSYLVYSEELLDKKKDSDDETSESPKSDTNDNSSDAEAQTNNKNEPQGDKKSIKKNRIIVSKIDKNSAAFGKLKVNDYILKINDYDLKSIELNDLKSYINKLSGNISFIISRHFQKHLDAELNYDETNNNDVFITVDSNSTSNDEFKVDNNSGFKKNPPRNKIKTRQQKRLRGNLISINTENLSGFLLETGVHIAAIREPKNTYPIHISSGKNAGSMFYMPSVGDRILSINGLSLNNKSLTDITNFLSNFEKFNLVIQCVHNISSNTNKINRNSSSSESKSSLGLASQSFSIKEYSMGSELSSVSFESEKSFQKSKKDGKKSQKHKYVVKDKVPIKNDHHQLPNRDSPSVFKKKLSYPPTDVIHPLYINDNRIEKDDIIIRNDQLNLKRVPSELDENRININDDNYLMSKKSSINDVHATYSNEQEE